MTDQELMSLLRKRFEENPGRHPHMEWADVQGRLGADADKLRSLREMEETGGEPDVVSRDEAGRYVFFDCSEESPLERRNACYDRAGQEERNRKGVFPAGNAMDMASDMGAELLTEEQYRQLQKLGSFDTKTSSWVKTPADIRKLGGALFADCRYGHVFLYHNSAPSFYSSRGFRGCLYV